MTWPWVVFALGGLASIPLSFWGTRWLTHPDHAAERMAFFTRKHRPKAVGAPAPTKPKKVTSERASSVPPAVRKSILQKLRETSPSDPADCVPLQLTWTNGEQFIVAPAVEPVTRAGQCICIDCGGKGSPAQGIFYPEEGWRCRYHARRHTMDKELSRSKEAAARASIDVTEMTNQLLRVTEHTDNQIRALRAILPPDVGR